MSKKIELNMQEKDIVDSLSHYAVNNAKTINLKSSFEYKWHCDECGQTFRCRAAVLMKSMMLFGKWCPVCTEIICVPGFNDLLTMHNGIAMEMSYRNLASRISLNVDKKVDFKCCFGHEFTMKPSELLHLFGTKYSCPECKRLTDKNLIINHPEIICDWDYEKNEKLGLVNKRSGKKVTLDSLTIKSNYSVWWKCSKCGHEWKTMISNRGAGKGCPSCAKNIISRKRTAHNAGKTPLTAKQEAASYWCYWKNSDVPSEISYTSPFKRWFWCPARRHEYMSPVRTVAKRYDRHDEYQCAMCDIEKNGSIGNLILKLNGHFILRSNVDDVDNIPINHRTYKWECVRCHQVFSHKASQMMNIYNSGHIDDACPYCNFRILKKGVNDFATTRPDLARTLYDEKSATTFTERNTDKREWFCPIHNDTYITTAAQRVNGVGCKKCSAERRGDYRSRIAAVANPAPQWLADMGIDDDQKRLISSLSAGSSCKHVTIKYPVCGHVRTTTVCNILRSPLCPQCSSGIATSKAQEEVHDYVKSILPAAEADKVLYNDRNTISPKELDICVPTRHVAIEYNGLYWHSCVPGSADEKKKKNAGLYKYNECRKHGIQLITIFEDDWNYRRDRVESFLRSKLGLYDCSPENTVYARRTHVKEFGYGVSKEFMTDNHIQGPVPGSDYIGLVTDDDRIVAMMTLQTDGNGTATIMRYATSMNVPGGFTKLLSYAHTNMGVNEFVTFSDNDVSDGSLYSNHGFSKVRDVAPDYTYVRDEEGKKRRHHKFNYRIDRFRRDPELEYVDGMTETQLAAVNGLRRVYDSGKVKWRLEYGDHASMPDR